MRCRTARYVLIIAQFALVGNGWAAFKVTDELPPGFADLSGKQTTEADVYFGGILITTAFVEYDPYEVEILDPDAVIRQIPNVRAPEMLAGLLTGPRPTGAEHLCNARRLQDCGTLTPAVVDVLFDEGRFRLDVFVHPDQLLLHALETEKYLPDSTVARSNLHNLRSSVSGSGQGRQFNLTSESFFARGEARLRARYGISNDGLSLYEMSWQQDDPDMEYEVGSFRTARRNGALINDFDLLGIRVASSTKRRLDLDAVLGTPIFLFLPERSRIDVFRGPELLHSRFYEAGNQQIDSTGFPDGAYDVTLKITALSGAESEETQFFVRSGMMPPKGEPQYLLEAGSLLENQVDNLPRLQDELWVRGSVSRRLQDSLSLDSEFFFAGTQGTVQSGLFVLRRQWHGYAGAMLSQGGAHGVLLRGGLHRDDLTANFDYREVRTNSAATPDDFALFAQSYRQGTMTVAFPLGSGRLFVRGRVNQRQSTDEKSIGLSYWAPLMQTRDISANLTFDANYSTERSWIQLGVRVRWRGGQDTVTFNPSARYASVDADGDFSALANGRWNGPTQLPWIGETDRSVFFQQEENRFNVGARFVPADFPRTDAEFGLQRNAQATDYYYAMNNQTTIVSRGGRTHWGEGGQGAGALVVNIDGPVSGKFEVLVDDRVRGYAWGGSPAVISLAPFETYRVRIRSLGERLVGVDGRVYRVTLYPGNVETLEFTAREIVVLVGQVVDTHGRPVQRARFENVEGFGITDDAGWFQVEFAHGDPLKLTPKNGPPCSIEPPKDQVGEGLVVVDQLVCTPILAQQ